MGVNADKRPIYFCFLKNVLYLCEMIKGQSVQNVACFLPYLVCVNKIVII
jgi:hypothetical protein